MGALAVDRPARTISGVAVPYGPVGRAGNRRWRFEPGAVTFAPRAWLLIDHDQAQRRGHVVEHEDTDGGLWVRIAVRRGPAGDRVLALAADGAYRGLSVGLAEDPQTVKDGGVTVVRRAVAHEVSLTAQPAFGGGEQ